MRKQGLVSVSFRENSPSEILAAAKKAGLQYIEWGSDVHAPPARSAEIAALTKEYGMTCSSYGTYFRLGVTPMEELPQYLQAAKILGTTIVRLWCGNKNSEDYSQEEKEALFAACKQAAALAKDYGVTVCMECHNRTYTNNCQGALELLSAVDSPHFAMYWQPNQFRSWEENLQYAEAVADRTKVVHVFHWVGAEKYPLKEAVSQWKEYLAYFPQDMICLLEFMPDDKIASLPEEAEALREIVQ